MLTKEHHLLEPFVKRPWKGFTFKEVKKLSKNTSDKYVHSHLKRFVQAEILKVQAVGNSLLYTLRYSVSAVNTEGFLAEYNAGCALPLPQKNVQTLLKKIKTAFLCLS